MNEIQALGASLVNKQVSKEDCFMILETNPLGFQGRLIRGHDDSAVPGAARVPPTILATKSLSGVCALAAYPSSPCDLFSRQLSEFGSSSGSQKTGSISPHLAKGPGRNTCTLTGRRSKFPLCQQCLPSPGTSCDMGVQLNVFPSKEEMTHYRKASLCPPAHPLKWRRC